jgi:2,3-dimethylmalate lyase
LPKSDSLSLKSFLQKGKRLVGAGAYDAFSARIIEDAGFDLVYVSSMSATASIYGMPDIGMTTLPTMVELTRNISRVVKVPVVADIEQGYGNYLNVAYNIREFENAGAQAVLIDDSVAGNVWSVELISGYGGPAQGMPLREVVDVREMCRKIKAASDGRARDSTLITVRCNLRGTKGYTLEGALKRVTKYIEAGADVIWAAGTLEEKRVYGKTIKPPLGLFTAIVPTQAPVKVGELFDMGIQTVVHTTPPVYFAGRGLLDSMRLLRKSGDIGKVWDRMLTHDEFNEVTNLKDAVKVLKKYPLPD